MNMASSTSDFSGLLTALASWLLAACAGWSALLCAAALIEVATSGRLRAMSWVGCPPVLRCALLAGLGVVLAASPGPVVASASTRVPGTPAGALPVPARPLGPSPAPTTRLLVRPGDTLWHLAARGVPPGAPAAVVCRAVDLLHRRNREVIGPDPDLLIPGQRLVVPVRHVG